MMWEPETDPRIDIVGGGETLRHVERVCRKLASSAPSEIAMAQDAERFRRAEGNLRVRKVTVYNPTDREDRRYQVIYEDKNGGTPSEDTDHIGISEAEVVEKFGKL